MLEIWGFAALLTAGAAGAMLRGTRPERLAAAAFAAVWLAALGVQRLGWPGTGWTMLALDLAVLLLLVRLTWKAPRAWPVWATAFEAVAAAASLAFSLQPDVGETAYLRALALCRMAAVLALVLSVWRPRAPA